MSVRHAVLGLLTQEPGHTYDLKRRFNERIGSFWDINMGQLYQTVDRLEQEGLVRSMGLVEEQGRSKRVYHVTESGRSELEHWIPTRSMRARPLRDDLLVKLAITDLQYADSLLELVHRQQELFMERVRTFSVRKRELEEAAEGKWEHEVQILLATAALRNAESELRWLNDVEEKLKSRIGDRTQR